MLIATISLTVQFQPGCCFFRKCFYWMEDFRYPLYISCVSRCKRACTKQLEKRRQNMESEWLKPSVFDIKGEQLDLLVII